MSESNVIHPFSASSFIIEEEPSECYYSKRWGNGWFEDFLEECGLSLAELQARESY